MKGVIIVIIIMAFIFTSCGKTQNYITPEILETSEPSSEFLENDLPNYLLINNLYYVSKEHFTVYDLSSIEYVGEVIKHYPKNRCPYENYSANFGTETTEIYQIDDETYLLKYDIDGFNGIYKSRIYLVMKLDKGYTPSSTIKIDDEVYILSKSYYDNYDLSKVQYIGEIKEQLPIEKVTTESMTSNLCPKGSKIYRIDESTIVVYYEQNGKELYKLGEIY